MRSLDEMEKFNQIRDKKQKKRIAHKKTRKEQLRRQ